MGLLGLIRAYWFALAALALALMACTSYGPLLDSGGVSSIGSCFGFGMQLVNPWSPTRPSPSYVHRYT